MTKHRPGGFSHRATKAGEVLISWSGKHVVTLRGARARRFLSQTQDVTDEQAQMVMARVTGNFKRGTES